MYLLYRKSDNEIVGTSENAERIGEEIQNVCQSDGYRGVPNDYAAVPAPDISPGQMWKIQQGAGVLVPDPVAVAKTQAKESAHQKLIALGLTADEIKAL